MKFPEQPRLEEGEMHEGNGSESPKEIPVEEEAKVSQKGEKEDLQIQGEQEPQRQKSEVVLLIKQLRDRISELNSEEELLLFAVQNPTTVTEIEKRVPGRIPFTRKIVTEKIRDPIPQADLDNIRFALKGVQDERRQLEQKAQTLEEYAYTPEQLEESRRLSAEKEKKEVESSEKQYEQLNEEFDRQIDNLMRCGFPELAGIGKEKFTAIFEPLRERLNELSLREFPEGHIPFVIVPGNKLLALKKKIPLMEVDDQPGFTTISSDFLKFKTAEGVEVPKSLAYLIIDIENGKAVLGKSPDAAARKFKKEGRSPLTPEEGVALVSQYPEILKDHYISLPGSRHSYYPDMVALLWLEGGPKLDWCESRLSSAKGGSPSCGERVGL